VNSNLLNEGALVETIPEPNPPDESYESCLYYDTTTEQLYYKYTESKQMSLQDQVDALAFEILKMKGLV
jgi:hypothetical protein